MPTTDDSIIEDCSILTTFDIGLKFTEDKYKGNTVESLQETYYGEDNQFVSTTLIENASIQNSGRKFMLIRARNEAGDIRVFLLGNDVIKELIKKQIMGRRYGNLRPTDILKSVLKFNKKEKGNGSRNY